MNGEPGCNIKIMLETPGYKHVTTSITKCVLTDEQEKKIAGLLEEFKKAIGKVVDGERSSHGAPGK